MVSHLFDLKMFFEIENDFVLILKLQIINKFGTYLLYDIRTIPFSLSDEDRKLVVMESFSDVVYLLRMAAFLFDHGSKLSSSPSCSAVIPIFAFFF